MKPPTLIIYHIFLFLSTFFFDLSKSGHVYSQTSEIIPQNANYAKTIHLFFMLETSLVLSDCLFIKFPMTIGISSALISTSLDISDVPTITTTPFFLDGTPTTDTTFYQLNSNLSSNTWYRIQITLGDLTKQTAGVEGCIWFATTSDYHTNYIKYDENRCFDLISFAPVPDSTNFKVTASYSFATQANINTFGLTYGVNFDIVPNVEVDPGALIRLLIAPGIASTDTFIFGSTCSSVACSANSGNTQDYCPTGGINAISQYNCSIHQNIINFYINQPVNNNVVFRISANVINPNAITSSQITVFYMSQKAELYFSVVYACIETEDLTPPPLSLMTNYPTLMIPATNVLLFWGLVQIDTKSKRNFAGCPIYLYTSNSNSYIVFNSLQTVFTITSTIPSFSFHSNLQMAWEVIDSANSIESFLMNSFTSNLPGQISCTSSLSTSTITCLNIKDLTPQNYYISVKFALQRISSFLSTFTPTPVNPTCGGIVISTGTGGYTVATITGLQIGVKKNVEYYDATIANTGDGSNIYYNQLFSYWSSDTADYNFQDSPGSVSITLQTFQTKFLGLTTGKGASAAVWPKGSSQKTQALLLFFKATSSLICSTTPNYAGSVTSPCDGTGGAAENYAVLLKIVFNNNVVGISKSNLANGVKKIGTLFQVYSSSTFLYGTTGNSQNYGWFPQQTGTNADPLVNYIKMEGGSTASYWHVSVLCYAAVIDASCYNILGYSGTTNPSISGISFIDTDITTYPTLYADANVFDFIICFKVIPYASYTQSSSDDEDSWELVEEGTIASGTYTPISGPGILNGYVITNSLDSNIGTTKLSAVNTYIKSSATADSDFGYSNNYIKNGIPNYLRIGFTINSLNVFGSYIGIFLNGEIGATATGNMFQGLNVYSDQNGNINILETISKTQITGTLLQGLTTYYPNINDFWWSHSGFLIPLEISSSENTFNFYIPIQATFINIHSCNLVIFNVVQKMYQVLGIYRILGSVFNSVIASASYSITGIPSKTTYSLPTMTTTSFITNYQTPWDQGASGCQSGVTTAASVTSPQIVSPTSILPGKTISNFFIKSDVLTNSAVDCQIPSGNSGTNWGAAFIIYARDVINFFSSSTSLTWDFRGTAPYTNKCLYYNIFYGTNTINTIFCSADAGTGIASFGSGDKGVTFSQFSIPFYWGASVSLSQKLTYAWSDINGRAVLHNPDSTDTSNWYYSSCVASGLDSLPEFTMDAPFTLTISSTHVNYALQKGDSLVLEMQTIQILEIFFQACNHNILPCSVGSSMTSPTFTLTSSTMVYTFNAGTAIIVNGWIDTQGNTKSAPSTYSVNLHYLNSVSGYMFESSEKCSMVGAFLSVTMSNQLPNVVNITSLSYVNMQSARGTFSITFTYPKIIRDSYAFALTIGVFGNPTIANNNFRCVIYDNNGVVSNKWLSISTFNNNYGTVITAKQTSHNGGVFDFKCVGGNSPDSSLDPAFNPIFSNLQRANGIAITQVVVNDKIFVPNLPSSIQSSVVSLTKIFTSRGLDSDYVISFKPTANDITTDGRIYIEFPRCIPPKLNKFGYLECYLNDILVFCEFLDERKVSIWPIMPLFKSASVNYRVKIAGVTQPFSNAQDTNMKVYFALDQDNDPINGISEQNFLTDTMDQSNNPITVITIHDMNYTNNKIRSSTDITTVINLPLNSISNAGTAGLWIQVPGSLANGLIYGTNTITASLTRVYNITYTNLVSSISWQKGRKLYLSLITDPDNAVSSLNYTLTLMNLMTSQQPLPTNYRENLIIFLTTDNITATAISSAGCRNTTNYLSFQQNSSTILLNWLNGNSETVTYSNPLDVNIGFYQTKFFLSAGGIFQNTWYFTFTGGNTSSIITQPPDPLYPLGVVNGFGDSYFYIACTSTVYPSARYFLSGVKNGDNEPIYSLLPILDIKPINSTCTPLVSGYSFDVPFSGGTSDPIMVDFSNCPPVDQISILANLSFGFNLTNNYGVSFSGAQNQTVSLSFIDMKASYKAVFYVTSNDNSNGTTFFEVAAINFVIGGTSGVFYNSPAPVTINLVPSSFIPPNPMNPTVESSILSVGCDEKGTNFFVFGIGNSSSQVQIKLINLQTMALNVALTNPDLKNDPTYRVYGYIVGLIPLVYTQVNITGYLKAGSPYTVFSFCMSNNLIINNVSENYSWNQPDNGGKTVVLTIKFQNELSSSEKIDFACALCEVLSIESSRIYTDEGTTCPLYRILQVVNSSNNISSSLNGATTAYSTTFIIVKDYLAPNDNTYQTVEQTAQQPGFISNVISQTQEGTSNFPQSVDTTPTITILDPSSSIIPIVAYTQLVVSSSSLNITFNLTNTNGFIYAGVAFQNVSNPNITQIRNGIDGSGVALIYSYFDTVSAGEALNFSFNQLFSDTNYKIFYAGTNLDTSINSLTSNVSYINVVTLQDNSSKNTSSIVKLNNIKSLLIVLVWMVLLF